MPVKSSERQSSRNYFLTLCEEDKIEKLDLAEIKRSRNYFLTLCEEDTHQVTVGEDRIVSKLLPHIV